MSSTARQEEILEFWFGPPEGDGWEFPEERLELWFGRSQEVDDLIRERFGADAEAAARGGYDDWARTPRGRLALLILLDQFPRHLHRGKPGAFAQDPKAQELVREGLRLGHHRELRPVERSFFYLPLEHAEDLELQNLSVALYQELADAAPEAARPRYLSFLDYAERHQVIVARFGRFPHRNAFLGRKTTPEEAEFLTQPGSSF